MVPRTVVLSRENFLLAEDDRQSLGALGVRQILLHIPALEHLDVEESKRGNLDDNRAVRQLPVFEQINLIAAKIVRSQMIEPLLHMLAERFHRACRNVGANYYEKAQQMQRRVTVRAAPQSFTSIDVIKLRKLISPVWAAMFKLPLLLGCAFAALLIPGVASADLVYNGGFETGDFTGWILSGNPIPGKVDTVNPHSGLYAADLTALGSPSFMEQFLATSSGVTYDLTYFLDVSKPSSGGVIEFLTQVNGVTFFDQSNIPPQPYTRYSFPFVATGAPTDLKFGFRYDAGSFFLDDVSVTATPEPSSIWLELLVTAFTIVLIRRRHSSAKAQR